MKPETKKALIVFLGLTFGLTIGISVIARLMGFTLIGKPALMSQMVVLGAMFISLGIWMAYIWFKTRSTLLAAFIHATFNANAYGIWAVIFVSSDKLIIGAAGLIGASLCMILGLFSLWLFRMKEENNQAM